MRTFIMPYKMGSKSAKTLAAALGARRVDGRKIFRPSDILISWGNVGVSSVRGSPSIINVPIATETATNKLHTLQAFECNNVPTVEWTRSYDTAQAWLNEGHTVYARVVLAGHSGEGIVITQPGQMLVAAPLYTKAILKAHEYRVHVFNGKIIDIQKKRRASDKESSDFIKNHGNGWVFCRDDVRAPLKLYQESIRAVDSLGLDFGAVDVLYKQSEDRIAVLEVNTAPGLEGQTVNAYANAIRSLYASY